MSAISIAYDIAGQPAEGVGLTTLFDYTGGPGSSPVYVGYAQPTPGAIPTDQPIWKIVRFTYVGGNITAKEYANGNSNFDNVWDDRADASNWP